MTPAAVWKESTESSMAMRPRARASAAGPFPGLAKAPKHQSRVPGASSTACRLVIDWLSGIESVDGGSVKTYSALGMTMLVSAQ